MIARFRKLCSRVHASRVFAKKGPPVPAPFREASRELLGSHFGSHFGTILGPPEGPRSARRAPGEPQEAQHETQETQNDTQEGQNECQEVPGSRSGAILATFLKPFSDVFSGPCFQRMHREKLKES